MKPVKIYTKIHCPHCNAAKNILQTAEITYTEINVENEDNEQELLELMEKHNRRTVPMIFIGNEFIGGYTELTELQKEGKLGKMLEEEGEGGEEIKS